MPSPLCRWLSLELFFHLPVCKPTDHTHLPSSCWWSQYPTTKCNIHMTVQKWAILALPRCISIFFFFLWSWKQGSITGNHIHARKGTATPLSSLSTATFMPQDCVLPFYLCSYTAFSKRASRDSPSATYKLQRAQLGCRAMQFNSLLPMFPESEFCCVCALKWQKRHLLNSWSTVSPSVSTLSILGNEFIVGIFIKQHISSHRCRGCAESKTSQS